MLFDKLNLLLELGIILLKFLYFIVKLLSQLLNFFSKRYGLIFLLDIFLALISVIELSFRLNLLNNATRYRSLV